jgi:hypothetical protein
LLRCNRGFRRTRVKNNFCIDRYKHTDTAITNCTILIFDRCSRKRALQCNIYILYILFLLLLLVFETLSITFRGSFAKNLRYRRFVTNLLFLLLCNTAGRSHSCAGARGKLISLELCRGLVALMPSLTLACARSHTRSPARSDYYDAFQTDTRCARMESTDEKKPACAGRLGWGQSLVKHCLFEPV